MSLRPYATSLSRPQSRLDAVLRSIGRVSIGAGEARTCGEAYSLGLFGLLNDDEYSVLMQKEYALCDMRGVNTVTKAKFEEIFGADPQGKRLAVLYVRLCGKDVLWFTENQSCIFKIFKEFVSLSSAINYPITLPRVNKLVFAAYVAHLNDDKNLWEELGKGSIILPNLKELIVDISSPDQDLANFFSSLPDNALQSLTTLDVSNRSRDEFGTLRKPFGYAGADALAKACLRDAFPNLKILELTDCMIGDKGTRSIAHALKQQKLSNLETLMMGNNRIGNDGMKALCDAARDGINLANLKILNMTENNIGDEGVRALAEECKNGALSNLEELTFYENHVAVAGLNALADAVNDDNTLQKLELLWMFDDWSILDFGNGSFEALDNLEKACKSRQVTLVSKFDSWSPRWTTS